MAVVLERAELLKLIREAVQGEIRFGARLDIAPELEARWLKVIDAWEGLCRKKPR